MLRPIEQRASFPEGTSNLIHKVNDSLRRYGHKRPTVLTTNGLTPTLSHRPIADVLLSAPRPASLEIALGGGIVAPDTHVEIRRVRPTERLMDKGNGAHPIAFAETELTGQGRLEPVIVAIKTFGQPERALREFINAHIILQRGIDTIEPLILVIDGGIGYLLTRGRPGLKSLDTDGELSESYKTSSNRALVRERMLGVANALLSLHENGIFHGDPQLKNFAIQPNGLVIPLDWEASKVFSPHYHQISPEVIRTHASHDLEVLYQSLVRPRDQFGSGLLSDARGYEKWDLFVDLILDPYMVGFLRTFDADEGRLINCDPYYSMIEQLETDLKTYASQRRRQILH